MVCPGCQADLGDRDVAACSSCGAIASVALIELPESFELLEEGGDAVLSFHPGRQAAVAQAIGVLFSAGVAFTIRRLWGLEPIFVALLGAWVVAISYRAVALFVNRVTLRAGRGGVRVTYGPLPWPGKGAKVDAAGIASIYAARDGAGWSLKALGKDGARTSLVKGLHEPAHALWLAQTVAARLC